MSDKISVLIIEKRPLFKSAIRLALEQDRTITIIGETSEKEEAINFVKEKRPHIILLDYSTCPYKELLEMDEVVEEKSKVILITLESDIRIIREVHGHNIKGFILMNTSQELRDAVKTVYSGDTYIGKEITKLVFKDYTLGKKIKEQEIKEKENPMASLTAKEEEVLGLLCQGLSNKEIAITLMISIATAKAHLNSIYRKLNAKSRLEAVIIANKEKRVK